jgi:hypothetical protein
MMEALVLEMLMRSYILGARFSISSTMTSVRLAAGTTYTHRRTMTWRHEGNGK